MFAVIFIYTYRCSNFSAFNFGTLTTGNFTVSGFKIYEGEEKEITSIIHALESRSSHPIARSLAAYYKSDNDLLFTKTEEVKGAGMLAYDPQNNSYGVGSASLFKDLQLQGHDIYVVKNNKSYLFTK